jgi:ribosome-associated heat shock protein Hsp15
MVRRPDPADAQGGGTQRLDKWLFFSRMAKTRPLAADLIRGGHIRVNGDKATTPAKTIRPGDVLTIALERQVRVLRMLAPGERRGPFPEARLLYEDLATPPRGLEADADD